MKFDINCSVGARFKFHVYKADSGELIRESAWSPNLVLNSGINHLNGLTPSRGLDGLAVGTGSSIPTEDQVGLDNLVAYTTTVIARTGGRKVDVVPYYLWGRRVFRFAQGAAKGNLTEVGICQLISSQPDQYLFFNRALIKDSTGQPTSITVLADEFLEVTVEVRNYYPETITGSFRLLNKTGGVVSTHTYTGKPCLTANPSDYQLYRTSFDYNANNSTVSDQEMSAGITTKPHAKDSFSSVAQWQNGQTEGHIQFGLDRGNGFNHKTFFVPMTNTFNDSFQNGWQWTIDPPMRKVNTQLLTHRWALKYGRYTGVVE